MDFIIPATKSAENWQEILWRERKFCRDRDYEKQLNRILWTEPLSWVHSFYLKQKTRPEATKVEAALWMAGEKHRGVRYHWQKHFTQLEKAKKKSTSLSKLIASLQDNHWLERFIARHVLAHRGGEAVAPLQILAQTGSSEERQLAAWLILSIGLETKARLARQADTLLCLHCMVRCHVHEIHLPELGQLDYYGCRMCRQSLDFQPWPINGVVAVLEKPAPRKKIEREDQIRVNWLARRTLFDFDRVEIIQATDEEVERFAVQIGNDTDETRSSNYKRMTCVISSDCNLSENSVRILKYTFGSIETR
jgi:hypothetical protein